MASATDLPFETKLYQGWRCSYRRFEPENHSKTEERIQRRLRGKRTGPLNAVVEALNLNANRHLTKKADAVEAAKIRKAALEAQRRLQARAKRIHDSSV